MAAEAGVLGTPFVRLNDFAGRLSYLNELEQDYRLGFGHKTNDVEGFYASIQQWLDTPDRKAICAQRREKMLSEKIDYARFLTWFIESYPDSAHIMREDPEYQWRFRQLPIIDYFFDNGSISKKHSKIQLYRLKTRISSYLCSDKTRRVW